MSLKQFDQWTSAERTKQLLIIGTILFAIFMPLNSMLFQQADPEPFYESQLSFNGVMIKEKYADMTDDDLDFYRFVQFFDYFFIISEIIFYFALCLTLSRKFEEDTKWRHSGYTAAIISGVFLVCDAIETAFIHLMIG